MSGPYVNSRGEAFRLIDVQLPAFPAGLSAREREALSRNYILYARLQYVDDRVHNEADAKAARLFCNEQCGRKWGSKKGDATRGLSDTLSKLRSKIKSQGGDHSLVTPPPPANPPTRVKPGSAPPGAISARSGRPLGGRPSAGASTAAPRQHPQQLQIPGASASSASGGWQPAQTIAPEGQGAKAPLPPRSPGTPFAFGGVGQGLTDPSSSQQFYPHAPSHPFDSNIQYLQGGMDNGSTNTAVPARLQPRNYQVPQGYVPLGYVPASSGFSSATHLPPGNIQPANQLASHITTPGQDHTIDPRLLFHPSVTQDQMEQSGNNRQSYGSHHPSPDTQNP